jgi:amino acid adenylation domain-containing protein
MTGYLNKLPNTIYNFSTLVELLRYRGQYQADKIAYTFLQDGETELSRLTYGELDQQAQAIAASLQSLGTSGDRALLLYPPSLEFISAFFGCLYAGIVAVPAYQPKRNQNSSRLEAIVADAQATFALTTTSELANLESRLAFNPQLARLRWLATDKIDSDLGSDWREQTLSRETLAFLQYTSGSTGKPKGVMVSHSNILHNERLIQMAFGHTEKTIFVGWLPLFHDMGLIGNVLQPLYLGIPSFLMSPVAFLQQPVRWLSAISRYKATTSGGPNFAYDLCVNKITPEQISSLDLRSWEVAFNGSEPIRAETLQRFARKFADCGFRYSAFYPCYGMAETTLFVSGGLKTAPPVLYHLEGAALEQNRVLLSTKDQGDSRTIVGCGLTFFDKIAIVDPESKTQCLSDKVGEIWVLGPSVAQGYWNRPETTEQTFNAFTADTGEGPFLRTGDLGFFHNGELFVTGRLKDMIIIRGRNHYPQDIELTLEKSHPALRLACSAAFGVEVNGEERLVVACEVERSYLRQLDVDEVVRAIRSAISEEHEIQAYGVLLLKTTSIPKTSSGKIQRHACRVGFLNESLDIVGSSILEESEIFSSQGPLEREVLLAIAPEQRQLVLISYLQDIVKSALRIDLPQLDRQQPLNSMGIDSLMAVELQQRIEADLGLILPMTRFLEGSNIEQLAAEGIEQIYVPPIEPIKPVPRDTELPLSFAQVRLWFLEQLEGGSSIYNEQIALRLSGTLDLGILEQALAEIVRRHEILRTTFPLVNESPVQIVAPTLTLPLSVVDLRQLSEEEQYVEAYRLANEEQKRPFDLANGSLLRVSLLLLGENSHVLLLTSHHIICDGWSMGIFIRELSTLYHALSKKLPSPLPELPIQFADFAYWQRQCLNADALKTQLAYWKQQLGGNPPTLQLPTDKTSLPIQNHQSKQHSLMLSESLTARLKVLSQREGATLFMTLLTAFKILLFRYTGEEDIIVGTPIVGRNRVDTEVLIGCFINTLALRTNLSGNPSFRELLTRIREVALGAYAHQDIPFEKLVEELQPERNLGRNPVFDVMFNFINTPQTTLEFSELSVSSLNLTEPKSKFSMSLYVEDHSNQLNLRLVYQCVLFSAERISCLLNQFEYLLEQIVAAPDSPLQLYSLVTPASRLLLPDPSAILPEPQYELVTTSFTSWVNRTPEQLAICQGDRAWTYQELAQSAQSLARVLLAEGICRGDVVAVLGSRSFGLITSMLAVLLSGGVLLTLDPNLPTPRRQLMLEQARAKHLLYIGSQRPEEEKGIWESLGIIHVAPDTGVAINSEKDSSQAIHLPILSPDDAAYIFFTSGTTGVPKGVLGTNKGISHFLNWQRQTFAIGQQDRVGQLTGISFDVVLRDVFLPLTSGATLCLPEEGDSLEPTRILSWLEQEQITVLHIVPTLAQSWLTNVPMGVSLHTLRWVFFAGELLRGTLVSRWREIFPEAGEIANFYGPTETTLAKCFYHVPSDIAPEVQPVGLPLPETQALVLAQNNQLCGINEPGEIVLRTPFRSLGYINAPEENLSRFVKNPFRDDERDLLYHTGDRGRYRPDGSLEILGRLDDQVKIRD